MGADLIVVALATPVHERHEQYGTPTLDHLNWEAGLRAIESLTITDSLRGVAVDDWFVLEYSDDEDEDTAIRNYLKARLKELRAGIEQGYRNVTELWFGGHIIIICGGTTGGDSPDEPFDAISDLHYVFDEVLAPVGFTWPERE